MNDMLQEQMSVLDELERTQSIIIDALLNRLIEDRADIMDVLTIDDFFSKTLIITQRSESEILDLTPQVKERVIEQRTLEARYRQLLIEYEAGLTDLINRFSNLKERVESENTKGAVIPSVNTDVPLHVTMPNGEVIAETRGVDTFVKVIEKLGVENVKALGIIAVSSRNLPLISDYEDPDVDQRKLGAYYIATRSSSPDKKRLLDQIAAGLRVEMTVIANPTPRR